MVVELDAKPGFERRESEFGDLEQKQKFGKQKAKTCRGHDGARPSICRDRAGGSKDGGEHQFAATVGVAALWRVPPFINF